jgi:hypothetical protein
LHAHQVHRTSQENGKERCEEASCGWTASSFSEVDLAKLKKEGFLVQSAEVISPSTEVIPAPQPGFRVMFVAFLLKMGLLYR